MRFWRVRAERREPSRFELSLRLRLTIALAVSIGVALSVTVAWWVSVHSGVGALSVDAGALLVLAGIAIGVIALSAGRLLASALLSPLSRLEGALGKVQSPPEFSTVVDGVADPELRSLLTSMIAVARAADARFRSKLAFYGALVHDLRTRVAGLKLLAEEWPEIGSEDHALVSRELEAISLWLRRILEALRLDQLESIGERQPTRMRHLIEECVGDIKASSGVSFEIEGDALVAVDREEMARALVNLLGNAARAARSSVNVQVFPGLVRISDDGPGLPRPFEVLAEPYSRAAGAEGRGTTTGTGLGLFVARRVLELHGGKLLCERTSGAGTVLLAYLGAPNGT